MFQIWGARVNSDLTEGRGPMNIVGYYRHKPDALKRVQGWGVQGVGDGDVIPIQVWDSFEENERLTILAKSGLSKLTPQEKEALGLTNFKLDGGF